MKELREQLKDKTEMVRQKEIEKHIQHMRKFRFIPGTKLFQFNLLDQSITLANVKEINVLDEGQFKTKRSVEYKDGCIYAVALNERNAMRKFINMIKQMINATR
jgi:hypothetical protein